MYFSGLRRLKYMERLKMPGLPHQINTVTNSPVWMRTQFGEAPISGQMGRGMPTSMTLQLENQMPFQIGEPMISPMGNALGQVPLTRPMRGPPMGQLNFQYSTGASLLHTNTLVQQQAQNHLKMQQQSDNQQLQQAPPQASQPSQQQVGDVNAPSVISAAATPLTPQPASKGINTASLCRIGQETVQDIVCRTQEVFLNLKAIQPPNGTVQGANLSNEKKAKIQEQLRTIRVLFKRLRLIYEKCNENCQLQGMEYTHIESLIPVKNEPDPKSDEKKSSETYRSARMDNKEIMEQVVLKNRHLKEVIDHLRHIIWEINTMLAMRTS